MISNFYNTLETLGYVYDAQNKTWGRHQADNFSYSDGNDTETKLYDTIANATDVSVSSQELREASIDWPSTYHFSSARGNILRPLADRLRGDVLEIGAGCGAITRYLGENGGNIVAIEGSARRAQIAAARVRDLKNVCVVHDKFEDFKPDIKFDAITLIGVLEYAGAFGIGTDPVHEMLQLAKGLLKPSGILIIAIENQLGLKYLAGVPEDHLNVPMIGIHGLYPPNGVQTFGRYDLEQRIKSAGYGTIELALPFPDYKMPSSVVLPAGIRSRGNFDPASLASQTASRDIQVSSNNLNFSLECAWRVVASNNLLADVSNSFLFVATPEAGADIFHPLTLAHHYSMDRRREFCKQVTFYTDTDGLINTSQEFAYGPPNVDIDEIRAKHPNYSHALPAEQFRSGWILSEKVIREFQRPGWCIKTIADNVRQYLDVLGSHLSMDISIDGISTMVPGSVLDAIPQNIICSSEGYYLIDQEWSSQHPLPIGYLVFRAITTMVRTVSSFAVPADPRWLNQARLFQEIFAHLGYDFTSTVFEDYALRESQFMSFATGIHNDAVDFEHWSAHQLPSYLDQARGKTAPILSHLADVQNLADTYIAQIKWLESENLIKQEKLVASELQLNDLSKVLDEVKNSLGESAHIAAAEIAMLKHAQSEDLATMEDLRESRLSKDQEVDQFRTSYLVAQEEINQLRKSKSEAENALKQIQSSRSWRLINSFAKFVR